LSEEGLFQQGWKFTLTSGVGWLIDFGVYTCLAVYVDVPVPVANMISSLPAITFVFCFATCKIFANKSGRIGLKSKYFIYLFYQAVLITMVSIFAGWLYVFCVEIMNRITEVTCLKILVKCLITPITMCCNFVFMKIIVERL